MSDHAGAGFLSGQRLIGTSFLDLTKWCEQQTSPLDAKRGCSCLFHPSQGIPPTRETRQLVSGPEAQGLGPRSPFHQLI
jgi:hypothetical protein